MLASGCSVALPPFAGRRGYIIAAHAVAAMIALIKSMNVSIAVPPFPCCRASRVNKLVA
jgi:hypothetical protein